MAHDAVLTTASESGVSDQAPSLTRETVDAMPVARLRGDWTILNLSQHFEALGAQASQCAAESDALRWDLRGVDALDHAGAMLLWHAWGRKRPASLDCLPEHAALFERLAAPGPELQRRRRRVRERLGPPLTGLAAHLIDATELLGQLALDAMLMMRKPALIAWRDISAQIFRTGAQALAITALVGFLVGVTLSYLTSRQLKSYGADIFIVNILGLSVWRELGPLLAAILVAGRSGSALTAQFGVMRVTQELDALSVMGISHTVRLVWPRVLGLSVSMPLVSVWTSLMTLLGGMLAAQSILGLDYLQFLHALPAAVPKANLWLGLAKATVFGFLIAFIASHYGLRIKPNSQSLGQGTTEAVVASITMVIVVDAMFAVIFSEVGI